MCNWDGTCLERLFTLGAFFEIYKARSVVPCHTVYNLNPDVIIIKVSLMNILNVIRVEDVYVLNVFMFFFCGTEFAFKMLSVQL